MDTWFSSQNREIGNTINLVSSKREIERERERKTEIEWRKTQREIEGVTENEQI